MRKLFAMLLLAFSACFIAPAYAADMQLVPPISDIPDIPPVDYGLGGSFYLRGSAGVNMLWAYNADYACSCIEDITDHGYGYSFGAGFGYETGSGLRADVTVDYLNNEGLTAEGTYQLALRSTLGMANVYYDFAFAGAKGYGSAAGGFGAYVGLGIGAAYNRPEITAGDCGCEDGDSVEAAGAVMTGMTYDMGSLVADLGYRGLYMNKITNQAAVPYYVNDAWTHEVRGSLRYRFN